LLAVIERVILSYLMNASEIYQVQFSLGLNEADGLLAIPTVLTVGLSPIIAITFDKFGKRCFGLVIGFVCLMFGFLVFMIGSPNNTIYSKVAPLVLIGVGDTLIQLALYTGFAIEVSERYFGMAFGILLAFQSLGTVVGTFLCGLLLTFETQAQFSFYISQLMLIYICCSAIGLLVSAFLLVHDELTKGNLNIAGL
jgi:MFS family permease